MILSLHSCKHYVNWDAINKSSLPAIHISIHIHHSCTLGTNWTSLRRTHKAKKIGDVWKLYSSARTISLLRSSNTATLRSIMNKRFTLSTQNEIKRQSSIPENLGNVLLMAVIKIQPSIRISVRLRMWQLNSPPKIIITITICACISKENWMFSGALSSSLNIRFC